MPQAGDHLAALSVIPGLSAAYIEVCILHTPPGDAGVFLVSGLGVLQLTIDVEGPSWAIRNYSPLSSGGVKGPFIDIPQGNQRLPFLPVLRTWSFWFSQYD